MSKNVEDRITKFVEFFREQLDYIKNIKSDGPCTKLYQQILYVAVLDSVSKVVYSNRTNRDRFVMFIKEFSKWSDCERVSLTHLVQLLTLNPDPAFEGLRIYAANEFANWPVHASEIQNIDIDPAIHLVRSKWPSDKDCRAPIPNVSLESIQHCSLFYTYRNNLIHEFRSPGYGMDFADNDYPYYHLMSELRGYDELVPKSVELVYPTSFFYRLCNDSLDSFEEYMKRNGLDPYSYYTFGTYWIEELNS